MTYKDRTPLFNLIVHLAKQKRAYSGLTAEQCAEITAALYPENFGDSFCMGTFIENIEKIPNLFDHSDCSWLALKWTVELYT